MKILSLILLFLLPSLSEAQVRANVSNVVIAGFDQYGRYYSAGDSAVMWEEIVIKPSAVRVNPVNEKPDYGTWVFPSQTFLFDASAAESLYFWVEFRHPMKLLTPLHAHIHWAPTSTHTGTVAWKIAWAMAAIDSVFAFTASDTLSVRQAGVGVANTHQYVELGEIPTTKVLTVSGVMHGVLIRDAALNSDTYTGDAAYMDMGFHFQVDSWGSRWETKK